MDRYTAGLYQTVKNRTKIRNFKDFFIKDEEYTMLLHRSNNRFFEIFKR